LYFWIDSSNLLIDAIQNVLAELKRFMCGLIIFISQLIKRSNLSYTRKIREKKRNGILSGALHDVWIYWNESIRSLVPCHSPWENFCMENLDLAHNFYFFFSLFLSLSSLNLKYFLLFVMSYLLPQYNTHMHVIAINFTIYSQHDTINHKSFLPFFDEIMRAHEIKFIGHDLFCTCLCDYEGIDQNFNSLQWSTSVLLCLISSRRRWLWWRCDDLFNWEYDRLRNNCTWEFLFMSPVDYGMDFCNPLKNMWIYSRKISVSIILQTMDLLRRYDNETFMSCKKLCVTYDKNFKKYLYPKINKVKLFHVIWQLKVFLQRNFWRKRF